MTAIRKEVQYFIDNLPDSNLEALKPILMVLINNDYAIETDLTEEEKAIIRAGREEYKKGGFISLDSL